MTVAIFGVINRIHNISFKEPIAVSIRHNNFNIQFLIFKVHYTKNQKRDNIGKVNSVEANIEIFKNIS